MTMDVSDHIDLDLFNDVETDAFFDCESPSNSSGAGTDDSIQGDDVFWSPQITVGSGSYGSTSTPISDLSSIECVPEFDLEQFFNPSEKYQQARTFEKPRSAAEDLKELVKDWKLTQIEDPWLDQLSGCCSDTSISPFSLESAESEPDQANLAGEVEYETGNPDGGIGEPALPYDDGLKYDSMPEVATWEQAWKKGFRNYTETMPLRDNSRHRQHKIATPSTLLFSKDLNFPPEPHSSFTKRQDEHIQPKVSTVEHPDAVKAVNQENQDFRDNAHGKHDEKSGTIWIMPDPSLHHLVSCQ